MIILQEKFKGYTTYIDTVSYTHLPGQCSLLIMDAQPQMFFSAEGDFQNTVMLHLQGLARTAKLFHLPCILSTVTATDFAGPLYSGVQEVFPQIVPIDRTCMNALEDRNIRRAIESSSRNKLLLAGLWTEAGITFTALSAQREGYQVYLVEDACAGMTRISHRTAISRMEPVSYTHLDVYKRQLLDEVIKGNLPNERDVL